MYGHVFQNMNGRSRGNILKILLFLLNKTHTGNREITKMGHTSRKNFSVVLRHGRTCSKMRGTVLQIRKQEDRATVQGFQSLTKLKRKSWKNEGALSEFCSHIVPKCLYLARVGRPDILRSVNKLARSVTRWTQACDRRLARLISYIHYTSNYRQCCLVGNAAHYCRLRIFQDSDFVTDLEDSKSTSGRVLCNLGSRTFVPISWMCKKQTSACHSSTESEIISLDAGLRMDG